MSGAARRERVARAIAQATFGDFTMDADWQEWEKEADAAIAAHTLLSVEEIAEIIHDARWAEEDAHRRTPFSEEDRRGREYCLRIASAVRMALAV